MNTPVLTPIAQHAPGLRKALFIAGIKPGTTPEHSSNGGTNA